MELLLRLVILRLSVIQTVKLYVGILLCSPCIDSDSMAA